MVSNEVSCVMRADEVVSGDMSSLYWAVHTPSPRSKLLHTDRLWCVTFPELSKPCMWPHFTVNFCTMWAKAVYDVFMMLVFAWIFWGEASFKCAELGHVTCVQHWGSMGSLSSLVHCHVMWEIKSSDFYPDLKLLNTEHFLLWISDSVSTDINHFRK